MNVSLLLEMAAEGAGDRVALTSSQGHVSYTELLARSRRVAAWLSETGADHIAVLDVNSPAMPILLFASGVARKPFSPINYRLAPSQLSAILGRLPSALVVAGPQFQETAFADGHRLVKRDELLSVAADVTTTLAPSPEPALDDADEIAVLLFTSGTSGEPKAAVLRQRHLVAYVISTVGFLGADEEEAALISVPPYHIAAVSAVLSSVYSGRRIVQLEQFEARAWVELARREAVTHAMVVPTMLVRILDVLAEDGLGLPHLRHLSYGGGRMPMPVVERAVRELAHVDFVNAYGLTETSSTVTVLDPDDHRQAAASNDPSIRRRLGSVGRPVADVEIEIRDVDGVKLGAGRRGEIWVRGEQVSGEYLGRESTVVDGWFATHDAGVLDEDGYLFLEGRLDDVIVRGGENLSPGEIEETLLAHPAVAEAGAVGVPDSEWGESVAVAVVLTPGMQATEAELQGWVRVRLRSSYVPVRVDFVDELPYTDTGKLLRRVLRSQFSATAEATP